MAKEVKRTAKKTVKKATTPRVKKTTACSTAAKSRCAVAPSQEEIRARAYEIYLRRNGAPGDAQADWSQAEYELSNGLAR